MRKTISIIAALAATLVMSACSAGAPAADSTAADTTAAAPSTTRTISPPGTFEATYVAAAAHLGDEGIPHMDMGPRMLEEMAHHLCDAKESGVSTTVRVTLLADSDFDWTVDEARRIDEELIKRTCA